MARDKNKRSKRSKKGGAQGGHSKNPKKQQGSKFVGFLKKRAPIYLAVTALFLVFVIPELTKGSLEDIMPELSGEDKRITDILMDYSGPNETGLTTAEAISNKITEEFGDRIFGESESTVDITVSPTGDGSTTDDTYDVLFEFKSKEDSLNYTWTVDAGTGEITADDTASKRIIDLVNFYD